MYLGRLARSRPLPTSMLGMSRVQGGFSPLSLFTAGEKSVWYDNQDLSTMFADFAMTPATIGSAVALQWDKANHGFGSEIKATGTGQLTGAAAAATYDTVTGVGTANRVDGGNLSNLDFTGDTVGRPFLVDVENTGAAAFSVRDGVSIIGNVNAGQRRTIFVPALATSVRIFPDVNGTSIAFTVHSVREVLGTPRYQTTSAQRPILGRHPKGGRRNLLTYTEDFGNAAWVKTDTTVTADSIAAPDGTTTADLLTEGSAGTAQVGQSVVIVSGATFSVSIYLKRGNTNWLRVQVVNGSDFLRLWVNVNTGAIGTSGAGGSGTLSATSITALADGWYRLTLTGSIPAAVVSVFVNSTSADNSSTRVSGATYYAWAAQLETGSTATDYQKVVSTYDCTETGVPDCYYLQADGSDDGMVTPSLDLNGITNDGQAVRNLVRASEKLDDGVWTTTAANATRTGGAVSVSTSEGYSYATQNLGLTSGLQYTISFDIVCDQTVTAVPIRAGSLPGVGVVSSLTNMVAGVSQRFSFTFTATGASIIVGIDARDAIVPGGSNATGYIVTIDRVQVELGSVATTYQKRGTDKIAVFTAARKLSDATRGIIVEFGGGGSNSFRFEGPANIGDIEYAFSSRGNSTGFAGYDNAEGAAPNTAILTGIGNIAGDSAILRRNGVQVSSAAADQGTGNYGNFPLYFFRRGGTTLPFNGLDYGFALCDTLPSAGQITAMETYINNYVGAY